MTQRPDINQLSADQLRALATELMDSLDAKDQVLGRKERELVRSNAIIEKLTHEVAILKRHKYARRSEQLDAVQGKLLDELIDSDLAAIEAELDQAMTEGQRAARPKQKPKRTPLPPELPRTLIHHEPDNTQCQCGCQLKRIGEDVSEKLDYVPGEFTVERHIRGKWACDKCETLIQAPVPAQVIDKGIPTAGLLAQVLVAKYADHLPLYRQERIFGRAGLEIPRSTLAEWVGACGVQLQPLVDALRNTLLEHSVLHADETPVSMLAPGKKKTHKAYVWAYCTTQFSDLKATVYDFAPSRAGEHARTFLGDWQGKLVCDDYAGYKVGFGNGITEIGCMAHYPESVFIRSKTSDRSADRRCSRSFVGIKYRLEFHDPGVRCSSDSRRLSRAKPMWQLKGGAWRDYQSAHCTRRAVVRSLDTVPIPV